MQVGQQGVAQRIVPAVLLLVLSACGVFFPEAPEDQDILDGPIEGLSQAQLELFLRGDEEFGRRFSPDDGLGPVFNATSCDTCHPGDGRAHPEFGFTRFGRPRPDGSFDSMTEFGGPQLQDRAVPGYPPEQVPDGAVRSVFLAPAMTGLGLLESVDDETILALADPNDLDADGISGRVHWVPVDDNLDRMAALTDTGGGRRMNQHDGHYIGRFGRKASNINLLHQTVAAYNNDMGITSKFAVQDPVNYKVGDAAADVASDPEIKSDTTLSVTFYLLTLRPPARRQANSPDVLVGQSLFSQVGCAKCHVPLLQTGTANIAPLSWVDVHAYTDLLLHDMGPALDDGYAEGNATSSEWRTPPLWGLGLAADFQGGRAFYLHDGRATTLDEAIGLHGGEAELAQNQYQALSTQEQSQLKAFLESL